MSIIHTSTPEVAVIPTAIVTAKLSSSAIATYLAIASYTQHEGHATKEDITNSTGLSANTISRCLAELSKDGWVHTQHVWHDDDNDTFHDSPTSEAGTKLSRVHNRYTANLSPESQSEGGSN